MGSIAAFAAGKSRCKKVVSPRLQELETQFLAEGGGYRAARIGDLFLIRPTKNYGYTNDTLFANKGNVPVVVNSSLSNGIGGYVALTATEEGNIITFSDTTTSDSIFYQPRDFIGYSHIQGMYPLDPELWNGYSLRYFVAAFRRATKGMFNYGNKFNRKIAKEINVLLPCKNGKISFKYMADYIRELEAYLRAAGFSDYTLTSDDEASLADLQAAQWASFRLDTLFGNATRGKRLKSVDRISGSLPFVTAGEADTGISAFIGNAVARFAENTVTIDMFGSAKYRAYEYGADDHVAVVHTQSLPEYAAVFVAAACHKAAYTGQFSYSRNFYAKDADELIISLPVSSDSQPDYSFNEWIYAGSA